MAFSRKEPILRDGLLFHSGQARTLVKEEGLRTVAAVPLLIQGQAVGVLAVANHHERTWSTRDQRMLISISRQVAQAIGNSQRFIEVKEKAQTWEANHSALQQANRQLAQRTKILEQQIQELGRVEQQIWIALAASNEARRKSGRRTIDTSADEQLVATLKRVLTTITEKEDHHLARSA
jgi:signal transduction protein with GAF and PtsI domain